MVRNLSGLLALSLVAAGISSATDDDYSVFDDCSVFDDDYTPATAKVVAPELTEISNNDITGKEITGNEPLHGLFSPKRPWR